MSGFAALTLVRIGLKSIAPAWYPSFTTIFRPSSLASSSNDFELDWPKELFSYRSATVLTSFATCWRKVFTELGYSLAGGLMRKTYSYPLSVMSSAEPVQMTNGTWNCWATGAAAAVTELE